MCNEYIQLPSGGDLYILFLQLDYSTSRQTLRSYEIPITGHLENVFFT